MLFSPKAHILCMGTRPGNYLHVTDHIEDDFVNLLIVPMMPIV